MFIASYLVAYYSVLRAWYIEMFASRWSSFSSIVPCSFESILMPKSLVQECYMMLICWNCYNLMICYFCCIWCVHLLGMSSTGVFIYAIPYLERCMPCIFVIYVVTSTSMQTRLRDISVFRDLGFCKVCYCCYFVAMYPCVYSEIYASFGYVQ